MMGFCIVIFDSCYKLLINPLMGLRTVQWSLLVLGRYLEQLMNTYTHRHVEASDITRKERYTGLSNEMNTGPRETEREENYFQNKE